MFRLGRLHCTSRQFDLLTRLFENMYLIMYKKYNHETSCIPQHFFFSISEKYCTKSQATCCSRIALFSMGYGILIWLLTNHKQSEQAGRHVGGRAFGCPRDRAKRPIQYCLFGSNLDCTKVSNLLSDSRDSTSKCKSVIRPLIHIPNGEKKNPYFGSSEAGLQSSNKEPMYGLVRPPPKCTRTVVH